MAPDGRPGRGRPARPSRATWRSAGPGPPGVLPARVQIGADPKLVEHPADGVVDHVLQPLGAGVDGGDGGSPVAPASVTVVMFPRWIRLRGVSWVTSTNRRRSFKVTSVAQVRGGEVTPEPISARHRVEVGTMTIPKATTTPTAPGRPTRSSPYT